MKMGNQNPLVLFVGSNPSHVQRDASVPFRGTKSETILLDWMARMEVYNKDFCNVSSKPTPNNRPLKVSEFELEALSSYVWEKQPDLVVALGATAKKALEKLSLPFVYLPHPSPKNRFLNDRAATRRLVESVGNQILRIRTWAT